MLCDCLHMAHNHVIDPASAHNRVDLVPTHRQSVGKVFEAHIEIYVLSQPGNRDLHAFSSVFSNIQVGLDKTGVERWGRRIRRS